jgi:hypothetical protein
VLIGGWVQGLSASRFEGRDRLAKVAGVLHFDEPIKHLDAPHPPILAREAFINSTRATTRPRAPFPAEHPSRTSHSGSSLASEKVLPNLSWTPIPGPNPRTHAKFDSTPQIWKTRAFPRFSPLLPKIRSTFLQISCFALDAARTKSEIGPGRSRETRTDLGVFDA